MLEQEYRIAAVVHMKWTDAMEDFTMECAPLDLSCRQLMFIFCQLTLDQSRVTFKPAREKSILWNKGKQLIIKYIGGDLIICKNSFPMTRTTLWLDFTCS